MGKEVLVKLKLDHKGAGFEDEASMLLWISACLNCNTNHVSAEVEAASSQQALAMLSIDSRNFTFDAVGRDLDHAQQVLVAGWARHREQCGEAAHSMPPADLGSLARAFDIKERTLEPGVFYRDHEPVQTLRNDEKKRAGVLPPFGAWVVAKVEGERVEGRVTAYDRVAGQTIFRLQSEALDRQVWAKPEQVLCVTQAASAEVKASVLEALRCSSGMGPIEPIRSASSLAGAFKKSGKGVFVVSGVFGRQQYRQALKEAEAAGLSKRLVFAVGDVATYSGEGIEFRKFEDLGLMSPALAEPRLPREAVQALLAAQDEACDVGRIGFYPDLKALVDKVRSSKIWAQGEVFVFAESDERFVIMKQVAPASCEMLTITNTGWLDVLTAYRIDEGELVIMLNEAMDGEYASLARPRGQQER